MTLLASLSVAIVGLLHLGFAILEAFLWTTPTGRKIFRQSEKDAETTRVLAMNQGLYNGFLALGLFWSLLAPQTMAESLQLFFLGCVTVAGVAGALTASPRIFFVQAVPAIVSILLVLSA
jgi:putative membrane protein